jgi:isoquinoline 1-oxidoreductase
MNETLLDQFLYEPEHFAVGEGWPFGEVSRREFFRIAGSGVVVALLTPVDLSAQPQERRGGRGGGGTVPQQLGAWLHVGEDGEVTVFTGKVEIGQNIRTSLAQTVADELRISTARIHLVMADTAKVPFDMGTFGSQTTPRMASQLRRVGAAAREALLDLAAKEGKVERSTLTASDGRIVGPQATPAFTYGELAKGIEVMKVIRADTPTTPAGKWTVTGTSVPKADGRAFVTGGHRYASDTKRPDMLHGKVLRPAALKAKLTSVDTREAEAQPGVVVVHQGDFVGVAAPTEHAAAKALALIKAQWSTVPQISSAELFQHLKTTQSPARGNSGSIEEGLKAADKKLQATYTVAYIAHAPLEPRAAVAEWADGKVTVWTGTQRPFGVRGEVVSAFGLTPDQVRVIVPDMGSGYGGKHSGEAAVEAARLARAAGKPVKLVWTREEEFTWAYFRPAGVIDITAGVKQDGTLHAWECHNYNSGGSALASPYAIAHHNSGFHGADSPLRTGPYRGLAATANHFARESHMDDLAHALGLDPLAFRLKNLKDERLRAVLKAAAKQFGWGKAPTAADLGFGIAGGKEKGSYVATCAEIAADRTNGRVKVLRAVTAFECGAVLNPEHLKNQVEGAVVMGLGGALFEAIQFANGKIENPRFSSYRVPRFADVPTLETVLLDRKDITSAGAGETPIVTIAPAIGNAIFHATGVRLRSMPMAVGEIKNA